MRNVLIAIGNSGDVGLVGVTERLLDDTAPLVRGMAVWALGRLAPERLAGLYVSRLEEDHPDVRAEWRTAIGE